MWWKTEQGIYMRHLNASLLIYTTYFAYLQSNSFLGSPELDLEFARNCNQQEQDRTFTRNTPCCTVTCWSKTISCLTLKMQHFPLRTQKKVAHLSFDNSFSKWFTLCGCSIITLVSTAVFTRVTQNGQQPSRSETLPPSELISSASRELQPRN